MRTRTRLKIRQSSSDPFLPSVKSIPLIDMNSYTWLWYGRVKIGKTTAISCFPKCLHFMWEPGANAVSIYKVPKLRPRLKSWEEGMKVLARLEKKNDEPQFKFRTVCFDTGEKAWGRCLEHMIENELGEHPNKIKDYGASWDKVAKEFQQAHLRINDMGLGFVVIAHETEKEMEDFDGNTYDRIQPKLSKNVASFYEGIIDNICYYHFVGRERMLQIRGDKTVVAGTRCDGHFLTPTGFGIWKEIHELVGGEQTDEIQEQVEELSSKLKKHQLIKIPMGYTPQSAYANLVSAFNNQQKNIFNDDELIIKKGGRIHDMR